MKAILNICKREFTDRTTSTLKPFFTLLTIYFSCFSFECLAMSTKRSRLAEFLFPSVAISRTGLAYSLRSPGIVRLMMSSCVFVVLVMLTMTALQGTLNGPILIGIVMLVPVCLVMAYGILPPEELRVDRMKGEVIVSRLYPGPFRRSKIYRRGVISRAIAVPQTVAQRSGPSVVVWRTTLQLNDGSQIVALKHSFKEAEAQAIIGEINAMLGAEAETAPAHESNRLGQVLTDQANANQAYQFFYWLGGALAVMGLGMIASAYVIHETRHVAQIVSATTKCEFVWRISEKSFERQIGNCDAAPVPARADRSLMPTSSLGLEFDVSAEVAPGKVVNGKVFLTQPEAGFAQKRKVIDVGYSAGRVPAIRHVYPNGQWAFPILILVIGLSLMIAPLLLSRLRPAPKFANA